MKLTRTPTKTADKIIAGKRVSFHWPASRAAQLAAAAAAAVAALMIAFAGVSLASTGTSVQLNCAASPHTCGFPDATNTGVQPGQTLIAVPAQKTSGTGWAYSKVYGAVLVTGKGANLTDLAITGNLDIKAANVTVDNVQIVNSGNNWGIGLQHASNALVEHTQIYSPAGADRLQVAIKDVYGDSTGTTITTTNIWNTDTAIQVSAGTVKDNYVHDLKADPADHVNGIVSDAGDPAGLTIEHNTVFNSLGQTDCIGILESFGQQVNVLATDNLLSGAGYTIYGGANAGRWIPSNIVITNNRIARTYYPNGGYYGPAANVAAGVNGNIWSGNIWDNTGLPVNVS